MKLIKLKQYLPIGHTLVFLFLAQIVLAQEVEVPLVENRNLRFYGEQNTPRLLGKKKQTLQLPFFDDFSSSRVYPDDSLWADNLVFINNSWPVNPVTVNVATFDGLNSAGVPYAPDGRITQGITTDTLTSQPIDLSSFGPGDSIYLSFFYQPKGWGDGPESYDSLVVQFKPVAAWNGVEWDSTKWMSAWRTSGQTVFDSVPGFKYVLIPLRYPDTSNIYHNEFQFRFVTYGNRTGNLDHWHVDYVFMNQNRSITDSNFNDVGIVYGTPTVLKRYFSMPFDHFILKPNQELRNNMTIEARNSFAQPKLVDFSYEIIDLDNNNEVGKSVVITENISSNYRTFTASLNNEFEFAQVNGPIINLAIRSKISEPSDNFEQNDVFENRFQFHNYIAYDDWTAEAGYGIKDASNAKVAYRFVSNRPDSLKAVGFYFNRSKEDVDTRRFNLIIWKSISAIGSPDGSDEVLVKIENLSPVYKSTLNGYHYYELPEPIQVNGTFYVGWEQYSSYVMNVGLDQNYPRLKGNDNPSENIFYNIDGTWRKTNAVSGALMIRPLFGDNPPVSTGDRMNRKKVIRIFPNPAVNQVTIDGVEGEALYHIYDSQGRLYNSGDLAVSQRIRLNDARPGVYFIRISDKNGKLLKQTKLLIRK